MYTFDLEKNKNNIYYWFYELGIHNYVNEKNLTDFQKKIIIKSINSVDLSNYCNGWLGIHVNGNAWFFMKNGFPIEYVEEKNGILARRILNNNLKEKYIDNKYEKIF
jgi:hypothetical protein